MLSAFQVIAESIHSLYQRIYGFRLANDTNAVVDAGTDEVIFFHHSAGKNPGFDLFAFSVRNSEADGWIFSVVQNVTSKFHIDKKVSADIQKIKEEVVCRKLTGELCRQRFMKSLCKSL